MKRGTHEKKNCKHEAVQRKAPDLLFWLKFASASRNKDIISTINKCKNKRTDFNKGFVQGIITIVFGRDN